MMLSILLALIQHVSEFSTSSHGRHYNPPDGALYYFVLISSSIIVMGVIIFTIKWFIKPGEKSEDHIKRKILETDL